MLEKKQMTSMENSQINTLNHILDNIQSHALSVKYTDVQPTVANVGEGELVVYDTASRRGLDDGVKRIYFITQKNNLGFITLT